MKKPAATISITVRLHGTPEAVVASLAHGLPPHALVQIRDGMNEELEVQRLLGRQHPTQRTKPMSAAQKQAFRDQWQQRFAGADPKPPTRRKRRTS